MAKTYAHGTFSWADLRTTDASGAKKFYCNLFSWSALDNPIPGGGTYTMLQQDGEDVVALSEISAAEKEQGAPAAWGSYITVTDVDEVTAKVEGLGGNVAMAPMDVVTAGRMSLIQDPTGAFVAFWQVKDHKGAGILNAPNSMCWNELQTSDTEAAKAFYTKLLGWSSETDDSGYTIWLNNGRLNGGMMKLDPAWGEVPSNWSVYISVTDIEATTNKAKSLGGNVLREPFNIDDTGVVAILQDPQGAVFSAMQLQQADAMPETIDI